MKNLILYLMLLLVLIVLVASTGKSSQNPFGFLQRKKRLIVRNDRAQRTDTLNEQQMNTLCALQFIHNDATGLVSSQGSIVSLGFFEGTRKVCHVNLWNVGDEFYLLTINAFEMYRLYRGYLIAKEDLDTALPILLTNEGGD
ncbi:MAG: hypothetical protein MUF42_04785 [Cytophagaceae bacterium]|jgi:hypothetical protein|nr:hypothetical protein [Cytophagaceae bacterium]